jgi:hypothetical protein
LSGTISGDKRKKTIQSNSKLKNFAEMDQEARRVKSVVGADDGTKERDELNNNEVVS